MFAQAIDQLSARYGPRARDVRRRRDAIADVMVNELDERPIERRLLDEVVIPVLSPLSPEIMDSLSDGPAL
jgi:hypothetical protein